MESTVPPTDQPADQLTDQSTDQSTDQHTDPPVAKSSTTSDQCPVHVEKEDATTTKDESNVDDYYCDEDADFTLVSSDNVIFKIMKYHILSSSFVFSDMIDSNPSTEAKIAFSDTFLESSHTIRLYLDFLYDRVPSVSPEILGDFHNLIEFAHKYECAQLLLALRGFCWSFLHHDDLDPQKLFVIAARLEEPQFAAAVIRKTGGWVFSDATEEKKSKKRKRDVNRRWNSPKKAREDQGNLTEETDGGIMNVACWSLRMAQQVPTPYWLALLKTDREHDLSPGQESYDEAAAHFLWLMEGQ